jgi:hypothetical protein
VIYTIDEEDDPFVESSWAKANPNWGVSVLRDDMEAAARKAATMPSAQNNFLTKRLNVWVNGDPARGWTCGPGSAARPGRHAALPGLRLQRPARHERSDLEQPAAAWAARNAARQHPALAMDEYRAGSSRGGAHPSIVLHFEASTPGGMSAWPGVRATQ